MKYLFALIVGATYFSGIAIAQGFWMTLFALCPPYGIYVAVERILQLSGAL